MESLKAINQWDTELAGAYVNVIFPLVRITLWCLRFAGVSCAVVHKCARSHQFIIFGTASFHAQLVGPRRHARLKPAC
jgi:hypothetical protein